MKMHALTLADLPPPPPSRIGWPWTEASSPLPPTRPDGSAWPRITIVTPSYNQAQFLEQTLRSVLLQGYPDLEYIVMDGGSKDGSAEILERYRLFLSHLTIGPDGGQSAALNTGFARSTGAILAWVNSDDGYFPNTFEHVASAIGPRDIVVGNSVVLSEAGAIYHQTTPALAYFHRLAGLVPQPAVFWHRDVHEDLDDTLWGIFDVELWLRIFPKARRIVPINAALCYVYSHHQQKTQLSSRWVEEDIILEARHGHVQRVWYGKRNFIRLAKAARLARFSLSPPLDRNVIARHIEGRLLTFHTEAEAVRVALCRRLPVSRTGPK